MITILHAPGKTLSKAYRCGRDGQVGKVSYDRAALFHSVVAEFDDVDGLFRMQEWLQHRPDHCVIRALPGRWHLGEGRAVLRRIHASVELADDMGRFQKPARKGTRRAVGAAGDRGRPAAAGHRPADVRRGRDQLDAARLRRAGGTGRHRLACRSGVDRRLRPAAAAAGVPQRPLHLLRHQLGCRPDQAGPGRRHDQLRLGFMLDRALTTAEPKRWLAGVDGLDKCTFNAIQPIYTAAPRFRSGLSDPMPERLGMLDGERDLVAVPEIRVEQRLKREAFTSLGPVRSAEGLGLLESPRLDAALERLAEAKGEAGGVRALLMNAMFEYAKDVGRDHVDIDALAEALADVAAAYRSAGEIAGYGLESMIAWALERSPEETAPRPHYPENGLPAEEATARLRQEMAAAVGCSSRVARDQRLGRGGSQCRAGAAGGRHQSRRGVGKTGTALEQIAAIPGVEQTEHRDLRA